MVVWLGFFLLLSICLSSVDLFAFEQVSRLESGIVEKGFRERKRWEKGLSKFTRKGVGKVTC